MKYCTLKLTASALVLLSIFSSCQKETIIEKPLLSLENNLNRAVKDGKLLFKLSDKSIKENRQSYINMVSRNLAKNTNHNTQRSYCSPVFNVQNTLVEVYKNSSDCTSGTVELTYLCDFVSIHDMTYNFKLTSGMMIDHTPTSAILENEQLFWVIATSTDNTLSVEYGVPMYTYRLVFEVAASEYAYPETVNTLSTTCIMDGSIQNHTQNVSLDWPPSYYTSAPAEVYIFPSRRNSFHVSGPCTTLICPIPHLTCPNSSTFKYRLQGTSTWTTVGVPSSVVGIPSGTYEYECVNHYSFGNSQMKSGTFVVN